MKQDIKKALRTSVWITVVVLLLGYIFSFVSIGVTEIFSVSPATGLTSTIGSRVIEALQGLVEFDIMAIITLYISVLVILLVGSFLFKILKAPKFKGETGELASELLLGTVVAYLILIGSEMPAIGTLIGLAIYYAVVVLSVSVLRKQAKNLKVL